MGLGGSQLKLRVVLHIYNKHGIPQLAFGQKLHDTNKKIGGGRGKGRGEGVRQVIGRPREGEG